MTATLAPDFQRAIGEATPIDPAPAGTNFLPGQLLADTQASGAGQDQISPQADESSTPKPGMPAGIKTDDGGQAWPDTHERTAPVVPLLDDPTLALAAACEAIRGRMIRARELEERLAREIGRDPALVAERALKRNCGAPQVNAA